MEELKWRRRIVVTLEKLIIPARKWCWLQARIHSLDQSHRSSAPWYQGQYDGSRKESAFYPFQILPNL